LLAGLDGLGVWLGIGVCIGGSETAMGWTLDETLSAAVQKTKEMTFTLYYGPSV